MDPFVPSTAASDTRAQGAIPATEQVLDPQETIEAAQIRAAVASAALGLVQAGIYEGQMRVPVADALGAAAAIYQSVYGQYSMHRLMAEAAADAGVQDAYYELAGRSRK